MADPKALETFPNRLVAVYLWKNLKLCNIFLQLHNYTLIYVGLLSNLSENTANTANCFQSLQKKKKNTFELYFREGLHSGAVVVQQKDPRFNSRLGVFLHRVCSFSLWMCGFSPGIPTSSQKHDCKVNYPPFSHL